MDPFPMKDRINEFIKEATTIVDRGQEALQHLKDGDAQAACDVIAISHYPIGHVRNCYDGIVQAFEEEGVTAGGGRR